MMIVFIIGCVIDDDVVICFLMTITSLLFHGVGEKSKGTQYVVIHPAVLATNPRGPAPAPNRTAPIPVEHAATHAP